MSRCEVIHVGCGLDVKFLFDESGAQENQSVQLNHSTELQKFDSYVDIAGARSVGV